MNKQRIIAVIIDRLDNALTDAYDELTTRDRRDFVNPEANPEQAEEVDKLWAECLIKAIDQFKEECRIE